MQRVGQELLFQAARFRFLLRPSGPLVLPAYKGSVLRGGFGYAFKDLVCIKADRICPECLIQDRCSYFQIFETPVPKETQLMRKYRRAPHPFVITPPLDEREHFGPDDSLQFELTLVGRAVDYLPYFIYTFEQLGQRGLGSKRGKFDLVGVESIGRDGKHPREGEPPGELRWEREPSGHRRSSEALPSPPSGEGVVRQQTDRVREPSQHDHILIYDGRTKVLKNHIDSISFADLSIPEVQPGQSTTLTLRFLTPVRISTEGRLDSKLEFVGLMKALLRRIQLLQYFHVLEAKPDRISSSGCTLSPAGADGALTLETIRHLLSLADSVTTLGRDLKFKELLRYSTRQERKTSISGFMGNISYRFPTPESLAGFFPFLRLGEILHLGKGTSFGLGKYEIS